MIEELAAVVGVQALHGEGHPLADVMHGRADALLPQAPHRLQLGPAGGDIHGNRGGEVEAVGTVAVVQHQIGLEGPRRHVPPLAKGADGHLRLERGGGSARPVHRPPARQAVRLQQSIDGGRAQGLQSRAELWPDLELPVPLQGAEEIGQQGRQELAAEPIAQLPERDPDRGHLRAIAPRPAPAARRPGGRLAQRANHRLAMPPGGRADLVQPAALAALRSRSVPRAHRRHVLPHCRLRHPASRQLR